MEEIIARLAAIEARLDSLDRHVEYAQGNCEAANQRRCDELDRLDRRIADGISDVRYEIDRVRDSVSRSGRGY